MTDSETISSIFTGAAFIMAGFVLEQGITFASKLVIARFLNAEGYGAIGLGVSLMTLFGIISVAGLNDGLTRYLPRSSDANGQRDLLLTAFTPSLLLGVSSSVLILLFAPQIASLVGNPDAVNIFRVFALTVPFYALMRLCIGAVRGLNQAKPRVLLENFLLPIAQFVIIAVIALLTLGSAAYAASYLVSYAVTGIVALYVVSRQLSFPQLPASWTNVRIDVIRYSSPLMISGVMFRLLSDMDGFLIGYYLGSTEPVGIYRVAYALSRLELIVLFGLGYLALPAFSKLDAESSDSDARGVYEIVSKWSTILTTPIFLSLLAFPQPLISLTFGPEYIDAVRPLRILLLGFFIHSFIGPSGNVLKSYGETKPIMWYTGIVAVLNLLVNLVLIPRYGITGAAVATTGSYILMNALISYRLYSKAGVRPTVRGSVWPFVILTVCFTAVYFAVNTFITNSLLGLVLTAAVYAPMFVGLCWSVFVSTEERQVLHEMGVLSGE